MNKFCGLLHAPVGTGKTPLAGTLQSFEKTSPCLFIDSEQGTMSLDSLKEQPVVMPIQKWEEVQGLYPLLKNKQWDKVAEYVTKIRKLYGMETSIAEFVYKSVVIDSGTELEAILRTTVISGEIPTQPDYLTTQARFLKMYKAYKSLDGISLLMTAGVREIKDEVAGVIKHTPDFQPSLVQELMRLTDFIFFMNLTLKGVGDDRKWVKQLLAAPSPRAIARSRSEKLKAVYEGEKFYFRDILKDVLD